VPRMVKNQLNHLLELKMIELDEKILKALDTMISKRDRETWPVYYCTIFLLLHIRELDAGRILDWSRSKSSLTKIPEGGFWIHPSNPKDLIAEEISSCICLLRNFHTAIGRTPLSIDGDKSSRWAQEFSNKKFANSIKAIQFFERKFSKCISAES
jgi:hypothetical protein